MARQMTTEEAKGAFRFKAAALVEQGNHPALRELFTDCTAAAMMCDGKEALEEMGFVLRDVLAAPLRELRRGAFDDLRPADKRGQRGYEPWT